MQMVAAVGLAGLTRCAAAYGRPTDFVELPDARSDAETDGNWSLDTTPGPSDSGAPSIPDVAIVDARIDSDGATD